MVIEVKPLNPEHKYSVIFSILSPNVMVLIGQLENSLPLDEQFRAFHVTEINPVQPEKAELPILVTDEGMVIEVSLLIFRQRLAGICSTLSPNVMVLIGQLVNTS